MQQGKRIWSNLVRKSSFPLLGEEESAVAMVLGLAWGTRTSKKLTSASFYQDREVGSTDSFAGQALLQTGPGTEPGQV